MCISQDYTKNFVFIGFFIDFEDNHAFFQFHYFEYPCTCIAFCNETLHVHALLSTWACSMGITCLAVEWEHQVHQVE